MFFLPLKKHFYLLAFLLLISCSKKYFVEKSENSKYKISQDAKIDSGIYQMVLPYKTGIDSNMNVVLCESEMQLTKGQPESTLGNFIADLILKRCEIYSGKKIDLSIVNNGGLRIPSLPKGNIIKGKIYELMPFDNLLVVMDLDGKTVSEVLNSIAKDGGSPVSGVRFEIKDTFAQNIFIGGNPLDENKNYTLAISDYLANGGDDLTMLKTKPKTELGILFRDAIIEYLQELSKDGKKIKAELDGRIKITK